MLEANEATVAEMAYRVGVTSPSYFSRSFNNFYGHPQGEVKYQRSIAPPKKIFSKKSVNIVPVLILVGLIVMSKYFYKDAPIIGEKSIAVLPFKDLSPDDTKWFSDGISHNILHSLAQMEEMTVTSFTSTSTYRDSEKKIPQIAEELGVSYILEGSVTL